MQWRWVLASVPGSPVEVGTACLQFKPRETYISVQAAKAGSVATSKMEAKAGRASYLHSSQLTQQDPGAQAVALWMEAVYEGVRE